MTKILEYNGYKCLYEQKEGTVSTVRIVTDVGSVHEQKEHYGISHFLEHMFFKGSENRTSKNIRETMGLLGDPNAYTSYTRTVYYMSCIKEDVKDSFDLLCEILFQPKYVQEEIDKESNIIKEELQSILDSPDGYFFDEVLNYSIPGIGHPIIGTKDTVGSIKSDDFYKFIKDQYIKDRICFIIVTSLQENEAQKIFNESIDKWSTGHNEGVSSDIVSPEMFEGTKIFEHNSEQSIISNVYHGPTVNQEFELNYVNDVFNNAFGGELHSILFDRVREKLGLCYSIQSFEYLIGDSGRTFFFTMLHKDNIEQALEEIEKCFLEVQKDGIGDDLLKIAKKNVILSIASSSETARGYSHNFLDRYFKFGIRNLDEICKKINSLTNNDVINYAEWLATSPKQLIMMNVD